MTPTQFERIESLFADACVLDPTEREAFLVATCTDQAVLKEVRDLLAVHQDDVPIDALDREKASVPDRIDCYDVIRIIDDSGLATVYEATDEGGRRVAIKAIKPGVMSSEQLKRFRSESSALIETRHPGLVRIMGTGTAGAADSRHPYLAYEYIVGTPLLEHVAGRGQRDRIELTLKIAEALAYAHARGFEHRDLRPGNVWIVRGEPKLLNLGVAHATDADLRLSSLQVEFERIIEAMTYQSPEQVGDDPGAIDGRSDIYGCAALLHVLLCGAPPIDLRHRSMLEASGAVRDEPPHPMTDVAREWTDVHDVVQRALAKNPANRHPTMDSFASDLRAVLDGTTGRSRTTGPRRIETLVAAGLLLILVALAGTLVWQTQRARAVEQEARASVARAEAATAELLGRLPTDEGPLGPKLLVVVESVDSDPPADPAVEGALRHSLALAFARLGTDVEAEIQLREAIRLRQTGLGREHAETVASIAALADLLEQQDRVDEAAPLRSEASRLLGR